MLSVAGMYIQKIQTTYLSKPPDFLNLRRNGSPFLLRSYQQHLS